MAAIGVADGALEVERADGACCAEGGVGGHGDLEGTDVGGDDAGSADLGGDFAVHGEHADAREAFDGEFRGLAFVGEEELGALEAAEEFLAWVAVLSVAAAAVEVLVGLEGFEVEFFEGGEEVVGLVEGDWASVLHADRGGAADGAAEFGDEWGDVPDELGAVLRERLHGAAWGDDGGVWGVAEAREEDGAEVDLGWVAWVALDLAADWLAGGVHDVFRGVGARRVPWGGDGGGIDVDFAGFVICPPCDAADDLILFGGGPAVGDGAEAVAVEDAHGAVGEEVDPADGHGEFAALRVDA